MKPRTLWTVLGILVLLAVLAVITLVAVYRYAKRTFTEEVLAPQERVVDLTVLVTRVRELNRLETASMRVVHVGRVTQSYKMVPDALTGDEITFLATGDVIAGIDLSKLRPEDVRREPDGTIRMRLPRPEILVTRVDNEESRVLNRETGVLRRQDVDLETKARQNAEINIRNEALRKGILNLAAQNGERKLAELMRTLGFERVVFEHSPMPIPAPAEIEN
jgi:hypothetical protein